MSNELRNIRTAKVLDPSKSLWHGPALPFVRRPEGCFDAKGVQSVLWSSVLSILLTEIGSRIMLPAFGSRLPSLVFEPNDEITHQLAREYVEASLRRWEPRIQVKQVSVFADQFVPTIMHISVTYLVIAENTLDTRTLSLQNEGSSFSIAEIL